MVAFAAARVGASSDRTSAAIRRDLTDAPLSGSPDWIDGQGIFGPMAFGNDGKTLLVGAPTEDGGIVNKRSILRAGDPQTGDRSKPDAGAAWLY